MELRYNGVDIYSKVSVNQCVYDSYGEQQSDTLRITFSDAADVWDGWSPGNNDKISVSLGAAKTGDMYITSIRPENGIMTLRASSTPETHNDVSNKSWENVHFKQLCIEIANRHDIECEFHDVEDQLYRYVNQQNKEDFVFLEERCVLEGCAFLVYDGKLVVYSESALESQGTNNTLKVTNDIKFNYKDDSTDAYGNCVLKNGNLSGKHEDGNVSTNKTLEQKINIKMSSQAEADRFSKNLLRYQNKQKATGTLESSTLMGGYAAGSVVNLATTGEASWDCPVFMTHVRHDFVACKTKLWFRKALEGY